MEESHVTRFEWDKYKAEANLEKHGVPFAAATRAFLDPHAIQERDLSASHEERWRMIGKVQGFMLVLVVHTVREERLNGETEEIIRIISARKAEPKERRQYERENRPV